MVLCNFPPGSPRCIEPRWVRLDRDHRPNQGRTTSRHSPANPLSSVEDRVGRLGARGAPKSCNPLVASRSERPQNRARRSNSTAATTVRAATMFLT
ncbi:hypothetical protein MRX96_009668 [Rhipicephalus microplus]